VRNGYCLASRGFHHAGRDAPPMSVRNSHRLMCSFPPQGVHPYHTAVGNAALCVTVNSGGRCLRWGQMPAPHQASALPIFRLQLPRFLRSALRKEGHSPYVPIGHIERTDQSSLRSTTTLCIAPALDHALHRTSNGMLRKNRTCLVISTSSMSLPRPTASLRHSDFLRWPKGSAERSDGVRLNFRRSGPHKAFSKLMVLSGRQSVVTS
jgi:hypothetical protein